MQSFTFSTSTLAPRAQARVSSLKRSTVVASAQAHGRIFNFSAGPACLPVDVLEKAQQEIVNWNGSGMSVMEMSHRGKEYDSIHQKAQADLRSLLGIPDNYKVLFLGGGASTQFASIPLNLTSAGDKVDHIVTGSWGKKAVEEATKLGCAVNVAAKGDNKSLPPMSSWKLSDDAKYVHICSNETIQVRTNVTVIHFSFHVDPSPRLDDGSS